MNKEVRITIEGIQLGAEEAIITTCDGAYYNRNGCHYILYEEATEGGITKNRIKIDSGRITVKKEGGLNALMEFNTAEGTQISYHTPYGSLGFDVHTAGLNLIVTEEEVHVDLIYTLSENGEQISKNQLKIKVISI
ncbi:MAG TPA: DUF1934 domain-containing protein [Mobilitalea sp.]|nr:DUF1934 domain-containing protein [Mobilitalea sp.]